MIYYSIFDCISDWDSPKTMGWPAIGVDTLLGIEYWLMDYELGRPICSHSMFKQYTHRQLFNIGISISLCSNYSARPQMLPRLVSRMAPRCRNTCHRSWLKTHTQQPRPPSNLSTSSIPVRKWLHTWDCFQECPNTTASLPGCIRVSFHNKAPSPVGLWPRHRALIMLRTTRCVDF